VHQPAAVVPRIEQRDARRHRNIDAPGEERRIDRVPHRTTRRARGSATRRVRGAAEQRAVRGDYPDGVAGGRVAVDALDRAGEDPGVPQPQRLVAAGLEVQRVLRAAAISQA
jgi:hypothetical protein